MGLSEFIAALGAVGISSVILALVKFLQFVRESNREKVNDILTRVDDDNKRWHAKYEDAQKELDSRTKELEASRILNYRFKVALMMSGIPESKIEEIEKEANNDE